MCPVMMINIYMTSFTQFDFCKVISRSAAVYYEHT